MDMTKLREAVKAGASSMSSMFNQSELLKVQGGKIEKLKGKEGEWYTLIIPKVLQLPFNPLDPSDETFSQTNKFKFEGAPSTLRKLIKEAMKNDEGLHRFYAEYIGVAVDEYDVSNPEERTETDKELFSRFQALVNFSDYAQKIVTSAAGQYGKTFKSPVRRNADGEFYTPDGSTTFIEMLELENAVVQEKLDRFMVDKNKSSLSADDKEKKKLILKSSQFKAPYLSGDMPFLAFKCDKKKEALVPFDADEDLQKFEFYISCGSDLYKTIAEKLGQKKDKFEDYLMVRLEYPTNVSKGQDKDLDLAKRRTFNFIASAEELPFGEKLDMTLEKNIEAACDPRRFFRENLQVDFNELFSAYLDKKMDGEWKADLEATDWNFKPIKKAVFAALFEDRMAEIKEFCHKKIYHTHRDLIELCNPKVAKELDDLASADKLPLAISEMIIGTADEEEALRLLAESAKESKAALMASEHDDDIEESITEDKTIIMETGATSEADAFEAALEGADTL